MVSRSRPGPAGSRPRIVVVGGSRALELDPSWWPLLDRVREHLRFDRVWHGARGGADAGVSSWARARGLPVVEFPAPFDLYEAASRSRAEAEARRNDDMLRAWGGYRSRGGSVVPCARAGGFVDLVLALAPDADTLDLVARASRWPSIHVVKLWPPRRRWLVHGPRLRAELTTLGDVAVNADPSLRWTIGRPRAELRPLFARRRLCIRPLPRPAQIATPFDTPSTSSG